MFVWRMNAGVVKIPLWCRFCFSCYLTATSQLLQHCYAWSIRVRFIIYFIVSIDLREVECNCFINFGLSVRSTNCNNNIILLLFYRYSRSCCVASSEVVPDKATSCKWQMKIIFLNYRYFQRGSCSQSPQPDLWAWRIKSVCFINLCNYSKFV